MGQMQRRKRIGREVCRLARRKVTGSPMDPFIYQSVRAMVDEILQTTTKMIVGRAIDAMLADPDFKARVARMDQGERVG